MGVFYTGGSVNPARSFGPCVVTHEFNSYHWIYWVGPVLGALLASVFYMFIKALEYETVNMVADPKKALAEKFDRTTAENKGEPPTSRDSVGSGVTLGSGNTLDRSVADRPMDTYERSPALEGGHTARH